MIQPTDATTPATLTSAAHFHCDRENGAMVENCGNCAFGVKRWMHHYQETRCHKNAPIVFHGVTGQTSHMIGEGPMYQVKDIMGPVTAWPTVAVTDFCGEWELQDAT